jgi:hypothetical protein
MTSMKYILFSISVLLFVASVSFAQPRPIETPAKPKDAPPAPSSVDVKYEGGMFGYNAKEDGVLKFDDDNQRLVFYSQNQQERFQIPYRSVLVIYPQSKSVTPAAAQVASVVTGGLAGFIKEKRRYLVLHFDDPDIESAKGVINFKLASKELLDSIILALADKAHLAQRGEAYYRSSKKPKNL